MKIGPCNKRGSFEVHEKFFDGLETLQGVNLFNNMIVLDVRRDVLRQRLEYYAIHPGFRGISVGEIVPKYEAIFTVGEIYPKWVEVKS